MPHPSRTRRLVAASSITLVLAGGLGLGVAPTATAGPAVAPGTSGLDLPTPGVLSLTLGGTLTIEGTPQVGQPLHVVSTVVPSLPAATLLGTWLEDGVPIPGATGSTYTPVVGDLGAHLSYRISASVVGLATASLTSDSVGPVVAGPGGVQDVPAFSVPPTVSVAGLAQVGRTLVASTGAPVPVPDLVSYQWSAGENPIPGATGPELTIGPDQVGAAITVRVTARKAAWLPSVVTSIPTAPVTQGVFDAAPLVGITGEVKVGSTLSAEAGAASPIADTLTYQWYADGTALEGATGPTLELVSSLRHAAISVAVTAVRAGFAAITAMSAATAPVATEKAPDLTLSADRSSVTLGSPAVLSWTSADADTLTASGGWSGAKPSAGSASVVPTALGRTTYVLSATNANGTTTMQTDVQAEPAPKVVPVTASTGTQRVSRSLRVRASGLYPGEAYSIRVSTTTVANGHASSTGSVDRSLRLSKSATARHTLVRVTGSIPERVGRTDARTSADTRLGVQRGYRVRATQRVTLTRLAPGEHVQLSYRGRQLLPRTARADATGTFSTQFAVGSGTGKRQMSVSGTFSHRRAVSTFIVLAH